ncbi:diguanylate cyclase domain-containing protein [Actinotalea subterranea]|uniref:diguanylate cyclase domain-containing protein n=1 Tax=Actinotalea subterranea TaxID=2607497 RepID=UPI0011ECFA7D|nr:diguanylate cyclase [Actinotalea subterranea]
MARTAAVGTPEARPPARRGRDLSRLATTALLVATVVSIVWGVTTMARSNANAQQAFDQASLARAVTDDATGLLTATLAAQAGLRGYLATEDVGFLHQYRVGIKDIGVRSAALEDALAADPHGADDGATVQATAAATVDEFHATLDVVRLVGFDAARERLELGTSRVLTADLRAAVTHLTNGSARGAERAVEEASEDLRQNTTAALTTASLVVVSLAVLAVVLRQRTTWTRQRETLLAEVQRLSLEDPLTGLANRRALTAHLESLLERDAQADDVGVVFLDLDGFKEVNDTHGHSVGDQYLAAVAQHLAARVRRQDYAARVGGDEFVVVVHDLARGSGLTDVTARVVEAVEAASAQCVARFGPPGVGVSVGTGRLSEVPPALLDTVGAADALLVRADTAMYAQKAAHRAAA